MEGRNGSEGKVRDVSRLRRDGGRYQGFEGKVGGYHG